MSSIIYDYISPSLTVDTAAYGSGDVVGGLLTFDTGNVIKPSISVPYSGILASHLLIVDASNQKKALKLYLFNAEPNVIADNAAFAPNEAALRNIAATFSIASSNYETLNSMAWAIVPPVTKDVMPVHATNNASIYGYLVAQETIDYVQADDLYIKLAIINE